MSTFYGMAAGFGLVALYLFLRWVNAVAVHDATVLCPRSMPSLRRPSDDWPDAAVDRLDDALEGDEHEGAFV